MSVEKAFLDAERDFDVCINCAAETRYGQSEEVNHAEFFMHIYFACCGTDCLITSLLLSCHGNLGGTILPTAWKGITVNKFHCYIAGIFSATAFPFIG